MRTKEKKTAASIKEANKEHLIELSKVLARIRSEAYHIENIIDAIVETPTRRESSIGIG